MHKSSSPVKRARLLALHSEAVPQIVIPPQVSHEFATPREAKIWRKQLWRITLYNNLRILSVIKPQYPVSMRYRMISSFKLADLILGLT